MAKKKENEIDLNGYNVDDIDGLQVTAEDQANCGVAGLPNVLQQSASENQKVFDVFPKLVGAKLNGLIYYIKNKIALKQDIPTKTNQLANDSGFITEEALPKKTSELTNDSGYTTQEYVDNGINTLDDRYAKQGYGFHTQIQGITERIDTVENIITVVENTCLQQSHNAAIEISGIKERLDKGEFVTNSALEQALPTKTSELANDSGFITTENLVGEKTEENGEIFNDYENNLASGNYSHVEGHQNHALSNVTMSDCTEYYYSFADDVLSFTLGQLGDDIIGFRIINTGTDDRQYIDVVKVLEHNSDLNYDYFKIETPISKLNLGTPSELTIQAIKEGNKVSDFAHLEGWGNLVIGRTGHAEGYNTQVIENYGHSEGAHTIAGYGSHVEGLYSKALGRGSHAEGEATITQGKGSHAEGFGTKASGEGSHVEGYHAQAIGHYSHAEGYGTIAEKGSSHAEGAYAQAKGEESHAEGLNTEANGKTSHAEGDGTKANGEKSHSEGYNTEANEIYAHAEGSGTRANGKASHSEGAITYANGHYSHAEGLGTIASSDTSHVQGKYNIEDTENKYAHIVGNGTSSKRSNAHTLDWNGNAWYSGGLTLGPNKKPVLTTALAYDIFVTKGDFNVQNAQLTEKFTDIDDQIFDANDRISKAIDTATVASQIALGRAYACSFNNYEELINWFNSNDRPNVLPPLGECQVGQNIYIVTLSVPDLWISSVENERVEYTYTTDENFVNELNTNGFVRVGKFKFSALETQKVDLTEYTTKEEVGDIETALDHIIAIQNEMIGGDTE